MRPITKRLVAAGAVFVAVAASSTAHAAPDPKEIVAEAVRAVDQVVGGGGHGGGGVPNAFPPAGFAVTTVSWSKSPTQASPAFTPPGIGSHPANWSCTTSTTATTAHAECTPLDPPDPGTSGWACYDPYVVGDVSTPVGAPGQSIHGTASCGTSAASCTATTIAGGVGHCADWAFPHQPVPLVCDADFSGALAATWTVRCAPIDP